MGMFDMLGKLNEVKKAMDEVKSRLDNISVDGEAGEGNIRIVMKPFTRIAAQPIPN